MKLIDYFYFNQKMSLNPQTQGNTLLDVLEGTVTSEFARQESSLLANELVNGQKRLVTSSCYGGNTPVKAPSFTRVCLSTNGATIADMANCFINAKLKYTLKFNKAIGGGETNAKYKLGQTYFIGFKQSLDALTRYDIYVNAQKLYTQTFVGPESFIMDAGINDLMRSTQPYVYTTWENVWNRNQNVCGIYIKINKEMTAGKTFDIEIPIKLYLHQFLILSGLRYLPSFAGRWELEMYFNSNNLVICPCNPARDLTTKQIAALVQDPKNLDITYNFTQINESFIMCTGLNNAGTDFITVDKQILSCEDCVAIEVYMNITQFQLRYEVFEGLRQHYAERPWIIPTNILQYSRFSGQPATWTGQSYHATLSQSLENCDSIFILIPQSTNQQTCFYNPYLKEVRMSLGEFGIHPARYVDTFDDPRFLNMVLDSLNLSESTISSMNQDVARSLIASKKNYVLSATDTVSEGRLDDFGDKSHFFIGISLSPNGFQNGCVNSPNTSIPFLFDAQFDDANVIKYWGKGSVDKLPAIDSSIICLFLLDVAIMIQVIPGSDIPSVKLTSKSIV